MRINCSEQTDFDLLDLIKQDHDQAFRCLFDRYYKALLGVANRYFQDRDTCRDIVQQVLTEFWSNRNKHSVDRSLFGYLRRAVCTRSINYLQNHTRLRFDELDDDLNTLADVAGSPEDLLLSGEKRQRATAQFNQLTDLLPEKCKIVFLMSRIDEMSHKEIAEKLSISTKTVENHITKAMSILKKALDINPDLS